ncbi:MAG: alpha/beta fold hydrolase [Paracoccus sp. (in: a-proteobacteria)]
MARIILVHGAWHGGWCWDAVAVALRRAGHQVTAPDLPGHAGATLADCAAVVAGAAGPALLVGHSLGGMVIEALAALAPGHATGLVHLCSYLPLPGDSLARLDRLTGAPPRAWPRDDQGRLLLPHDAARQMLYAGCPEAAVATTLARLRPQPVGPMRDPLTARADLPRDYVLCRDDRAIPQALQRRMLDRAPVTQQHDRDWGHSPFLQAPDDLAALLDQIARRG